MLSDSRGWRIFIVWRVKRGKKGGGGGGMWKKKKETRECIFRCGLKSVVFYLWM